jgi:glycosyltransferase involved in cell wall biosynthesis
MKIAQIVCAYPPYAGGIGNSAEKIYKLIKNKHKIVNFTPDNIKPWLRCGHGAFMPQLLWKLKKFDYLYLHYPFFGTTEVVWLYKLINPKIKLIIHYHMDVKNKSLKNRILSWPNLIIRNNLLKRADIIISASLDYIKNSQIKNFYKKYPEKFEEIPFALDIDEFKPKEINLPSQNKIIAKAKDLIKKVNELFIKKNRLDLIFIGGLDKAHYFKGIPTLLEALALWDKKNWRLQIIGDGDLKAEYQTLAARLGIFNQIIFSGQLPKDDLIRSLQNSDLLVLPSINQNEAFGLVLIEALACGVPVIASNLPGVRSVFTDHQEGLFIEPGNKQDLKDKLEFIANHEKIREIMAKNARLLAIKKYNQEKIKQTYENLFNK